MVRIHARQPAQDQVFTDHHQKRWKRHLSQFLAIFAGFRVLPPFTSSGSFGEQYGEELVSQAFRGLRTGPRSMPPARSRDVKKPGGGRAARGVPGDGPAGRGKGRAAWEEAWQGTINHAAFPLPLLCPPGCPQSFSRSFKNSSTPSNFFTSAKLIACVASLSTRPVFFHASHKSRMARAQTISDSIGQTTIL